MTEWLATIRFLHLAALSLLVGGFSFNLLVARPAFKRGGPEMSPSFVVNSRKQFRFGLYSLPLAIVFAVLEFVFKISAITGLPLAASFDLNAAADVLFGTRYGTVWTIRLALACPLAALFLLEMAERKKSDSISLNSVGLILSAFFLMTLAFAGHASAT